MTPYKQCLRIIVLSVQGQQNDVIPIMKVSLVIPVPAAVSFRTLPYSFSCGAE